MKLKKYMNLEIKIYPKLADDHEGGTNQKIGTLFSLAVLRWKEFGASYIYSVWQERDKKARENVASDFSTLPRQIIQSVQYRLRKTTLLRNAMNSNPRYDLLHNHWDFADNFLGQSL